MVSYMPMSSCIYGEKRMMRFVVIQSIKCTNVQASYELHKLHKLVDINFMKIIIAFGHDKLTWTTSSRSDRAQSYTDSFHTEAWNTSMQRLSIRTHLH